MLRLLVSHPRSTPAPAALDAHDRAGLLTRLEQGEYDCLVVGGGITGAGIAREASRRGLRVALVEAEDFAAGTSGRSSKLVHGGLRYLALGEVSLVRETALERRHVHALAKHLAEPCWMIVPARSRAGLLKFRAGLLTYEKLGSVDEADRHRSWGIAELERSEPLLRRDRTPFACCYREYLTEDARLVLANLRDARRHGAEIANHLRVEAIDVEDSRARAAMLRCRLTGTEIRVKAKVIVNAAGPWVEAIRRLEDPAAPSLLHLSKGVHVVLPAERLPIANVVVFGASDRRSLFAVPRGDVVYVGTTDTSYTGGTDVWPTIDRHDVEYLLDPLARFFDVEPVRPEECVGAWSGLRPLIAQAGKPPAEISRRDEVWIGPAGVITIAGGKLTGHRKMAATVVAQVAAALDRTLADPDPEAPLPGGDFAGEIEVLSSSLRAAFGLDPLGAGRLARLYGSEAAAVAERGAKPVLPGGRVLEGEVRWAIEEEAAATVCDVLYRRTRAALYEPAEREALVVPISDRMAERFAWSPARREREIESVRERLAAELAFRNPPGA